MHKARLSLNWSHEVLARKKKETEKSHYCWRTGRMFLWTRDWR